jgi:hypothetical protein
MGLPASTRSPECTKIRVICPSTCGMITADSRDFSVATYSDASLTGTACACSTLTGIAPGPAACGFCAPLLEQPTVIALAAKTAASKLFAADSRMLFAISRKPLSI